MKGFIMRNSIRVGRIAGVNIGLHWSIALIAGILTFALAGTILPVLTTDFSSSAYLIVAIMVSVAFLASIVAHELGHSVVAQNNGVGVSGITLFALGGVAVLDSEPPTAGAAARIALAGPAVSVAIGIGAIGLAVITVPLGLSPLIAAGLMWLGLINLALAAFNMLPALPLDGGRVLQAALWRRSGDRQRATISAATVGRYLGWAMVAFGFWQFTAGGAGLWTALIGWFIASAARAEGARARFELRRRDWPRPEWPAEPFPPASSPV